MTDAMQSVSRLNWRDGAVESDADCVVAEVPVALVYNGISHVVMMATPTHLEDLALGFSLSEGIIQSTSQMLDCELQRQERGLELQITVTNQCFAALKTRRRNLTGRTGCGLCGLESLDQAIPELPLLEGSQHIEHRALQAALADLDEAQTLKRHTGGVHGAAWCGVDGNIVLMREDVGRHNALDKMLGALWRGEQREPGFVLVTSRASYEMVAKVANCGIEILAAVSAPTSLAIEQAESCGLTLAGFVQPGRQVIYTHPGRIVERG